MSDSVCAAKTLSGRNCAHCRTGLWWHLFVIMDRVPRRRSKPSCCVRSAIGFAKIGRRLELLSVFPVLACAPPQANSSGCSDILKIILFCRSEETINNFSSRRRCISRMMASHYQVCLLTDESYKSFVKDCCWTVAVEVVKINMNICV